MKEFEITRSPAHRPRKRRVTEDYFARSRVGRRVLKLEVGEVAPDHYRSAGLWRIKRVK